MLGVMRFDTSKLVNKPELPAEETDYHKTNRFYSSDLLQKPEFVFKNQLITMKDADLELLEQALANEEAEESKRALLASQDGNVSQAELKGGKAKDPKKDAKSAPKKGAQVEADKNCPKPIEIEYPEIQTEKDYVIMERSF